MVKKKNALTSKNKQPPTTKPWLKCGEVGTYAKLNQKRAKPKFERDHVPSHAAMNKAAQNSKDMKGASKKVRKCVKNKLKDRALTIAIPKSLHRGTSRTCGSRNNQTQIKSDSKNLKSATTKDLAKIQKKLDGPPKSPCAAAYRKAAKDVRAQNHKKLIKDIIDECRP